MAKSTLVYGTDPEFFAGYISKNKMYCLPPVYFRTTLGVEATPNGRHPIFLRDKKAQLYVHEDGAAFEMALAPSTNWEDLFDRVQLGKQLLEEQLLKKFDTICEPKVLTYPTIGYEVERWKDADDEFIWCTQFGCDPDHDVFNTKKKEEVMDASQHPFRYGGGHIHVSGSKVIKDEPLNAVYSLALTAGLAAVAYSDAPEMDRNRTYLYGMPGKYRIQKYPKSFGKHPFTNTGIEYRTPSNRWTGNKDLATQVFTWLNIGIRNLLEGNLITEIIKDLQEPATKAILECDQKEAKNILSHIATLV